MDAEDPGDPKDQMGGICGRDRRVARRLGGAVDIEGCDRLVLAIGCGAGAGIDVIGRQVE
jgi:hypothetical protein